MNYRKLEKKGYNLHLINTEKFKTTRVTVKLQRELKKEEATIRSLLSLLIMNGTKKLPSQIALSRELEMLYGANIATSVIKKGLSSILSVSMSLANEEYVDDHVLDKGLNILSDLLYNPAPLTEELLNREKRQLKERLESLYDNKMRYSLRRLIEIMGEGEPFAITVDGYLDEIDGITIDDVDAYRHEIVKNDVVDIFVVGQLDEEYIEKLIDQLFTFETENHAIDVLNTESKEATKQVVDEIQELSQGKLNIGYRAYTTLKDSDYYAMVVANGILGAFPHSKLFLNVREKASLCYYVASSYDSYNGLLLIYSGIETQNYDQALQIIREQVEEMKKGNVSEEELVQTKAMLTNGMYESFDSAGGMMDFYYSNIITGIHESLEEWVRKINDVTKEQVVDAISKIEEDCIYFLHGGKK